MEVSKNIKSYLEVTAGVLLGITVWILICIYVLCTLPIYLYRFIIVHLLVPYFFPKIGKPITLKGQGCATDFIKEHLSYSYRSSLVVTNTYTGTICQEKMKDLWLLRCINKKDNLGRTMYPELKQFIHPFMGFMFWKDDNNFKLENHIFVHDIGNDSTDDSSQSFCRNLREGLLGKGFISKRSPWELHIIHNYRNCSISDEKMSVIMFLIHHSVGDGTSLLDMLGDFTYGQEVETFNSIIPRTKNATNVSLIGIISFLLNLLRMVYDSGYLVMLYLQRSRIPWLVPDSQKSFRFLSEKTKDFPVDKLKLIKNKFDVGFTTVLLSCISAAISKALRDQKFAGFTECDTIPVLLPIPKWNSTKRLRFLGTGMIVNLPIQHKPGPVKRLLSCQQQLLFAKRSTIPLLMNIASHLFVSNVSTISRYLGRNRFIPIAVSIFPLPDNEGVMNGVNKLLAFDIFSGGMLGNGGVVFHVPSFENQLKICITSEGNLLGRETLKELVGTIEDELEMLMRCIPETVQHV